MVQQKDRKKGVLEKVLFWTLPLACLEETPKGEKVKKEYIVKINGEKLFFLADDIDQAREMVEKGLNLYRDVCEHETYEGGQCIECGLECEHEDTQMRANKSCLYCTTCETDFFDEDGDQNAE